MKKTSFNKLKAEDQVLLRAAQAAMERAYNPYSQYFVGSALLTPDGQTVTGSNFENASYSVTICSERSAIVRASAMGHNVFKKIAVLGRGAKSPSKDVVSPCGVCRQMLFESSQISGAPLEVIMCSSDMKKVVIATIDELLPLGFGPASLGVNIKRFRR